MAINEHVGWKRAGEVILWAAGGGIGGFFVFACAPGSWEAKAVTLGLAVLGLGGLGATLAAAVHPRGGKADHWSKLLAVATFTAGMAGAAAAGSAAGGLFASTIPGLVALGGVLLVCLVGIWLSRVGTKPVGPTPGTAGVTGAGTAESDPPASGAGSGALIVLLVGLLLLRILRK